MRPKTTTTDIEGTTTEVVVNQSESNNRNLEFESFVDFPSWRTMLFEFLVFILKHANCNILNKTTNSRQIITNRNTMNERQTKNYMNEIYKWKQT